MIHRIQVFFLSLVIAISPIIFINNANAASIGGWSLSNPVAKGASTLYQGAKNAIINGKNVAKTSTALITPNASQVANILKSGVGAAALTLAVAQLIGQGVDWVLDPANNSVNYNTEEKVYIGVWGTGSGSTYTTGEAAAAAKCAEKGQIYRGVDKKRQPPLALCTTKTGYNDQWSITFEGKVVTEKEPKSLPLDVVAAQVISNAQSGHTDAQVATTAAAANIISEAEKDAVKARPIVNQLEANSKTATDETATGEAVPKDPTAPDAAKPTDISLEFPVFCSWAPTVCEAAQTVISFPRTLTEWWETSNSKADGWVNSISQAWTAVKDWVKTEEPAERQTKVDIESPVVPEMNNNYLQWNAYCPFTAKSDEISINGETSALSSDLTSWCTMASEIRPFVLLAGALASLMIVSGVGLGRSED